MNNERRKQIANAVKGLREAANMLPTQALTDLVTSAKDDLEGARDDEQEYFDNMPEALQGGEKGSVAEEAVRSLEEALEYLSDFLSEFEGLSEKLDNAIGSAESAA
jgi:ABC-type transporter Mla subunit MlaD